MSLLPVAEAQARLLALAAPLPTEEAALAAAAGRWAAADVIARRTQPAADLSAMDGYAIRAADLPGPWQMAGESKAGGAVPPPLAADAAQRIFTGAALPSGADTILIQEDAACEGGRLRLTGDTPPPGSFVRRRGADFAEGAVLVHAGELLTPARIAVAAMGGHGAMPVRRRPRVLLIATGDELVPPGAPTPGVMLPASNGIMLQAMIGTMAEVRDGGIVPDRLEPLVETFRTAAADIIVTSGGVSVGDHDLVRPALQAAGAAIDFWRIAMRPGKPLLAGRLGDAIVLGLPGNPASAFVTARLFLLPLITHLAGAAAPIPVAEPAILDAPLAPGGSRAEYLRAVSAHGRVTPVVDQDSAMLTALARADALIVRAADAPAANVGESVDILRIA